MKRQCISRSVEESCLQSHLLECYLKNIIVDVDLSFSFSLKAFKEIREKNSRNK